MAELATGHLKGVTNGAALVLGSGLGGGIIINGKLFQGGRRVDLSPSSSNGKT
nr:hypothetical protein [Streptococcus thermophilus]